MKEIETRAMIKTNQIALLKNKLLEIGFKNTDSYSQTDIMLDNKEGGLFKSGQKIRLRVEKGKAELTYKGLFEGEQNFSRRIEINVPLSNASVDDILLMFTALNYPVLFQIKKERTVFKNDNVVATLDNWPILGYILELESLYEQSINDVIVQLPNELLFNNTRLKDLFHQKTEETGKSFAELKAAYETESGFKLGNIEMILE